MNTILRATFRVRALDTKAARLMARAEDSSTDHGYILEPAGDNLLLYFDRGARMNFIL